MAATATLNAQSGRPNALDTVYSVESQMNIQEGACKLKPSL